MTKQQHPSIWVFPTAVLLAALMSVVALVVGHLAVPERSLNLERFKSATGTPYVVAIGTSRTRDAIDYDDQFTERSGLPNGLVFHRITLTAGTPRLFEPALTALLVNPPDLLLVESDLLLVDRHRPIDRPWWSTTLPELQLDLRRLSRNLSLLVEGRAVQNRHDGNDGVDLGQTPEVCALGKSSEAQQDYADFIAKWSVTQPETITPLLKPLKRLRQLGTTVVLLDVPVSAAAARLMPANLEQQIALHRERLEAELQAPFWSPGPLPDSNYCDIRHLNHDDGRNRYSDWLAKQINAWQESRD